MNLKKYLENRIRGWLPKELSLPRNQRTGLVDHLMRLRLLRLAYGVMLGALLVTPFGVYHSRVEPYITGYLWGYHLPIGYVGVLLGIAAVLYPRLNALRRLRFSSFMPFIGLFLLLTFFFSPKDYFINLLHGTNFSPAQIDVDFAVGNSAVLGLSILSIVFGLVSFIRGWLPEEPNSPSFPTATSRKNEQSRKIKHPISMMLFPFIFIIMSAAQFFEGNAMGAFYLWLSCIIGLYLALDILVSRGKELNEKFVAGLLLGVISLGGILANLYVFSMPTSFFTRVFSLSVLALVHVPLLFAVIAYVWGKKELSKKLIGWFSSRS